MMENRNLIFHGILSSACASVAGIVYFEIYQYLMFTSFDAVVNWGSIIGASTIGCLLMMLSYWTLSRFSLIKLTGWMNVLIAIVSFVSIIGAMNTALPLDIDYPELFPGLMVPMHFFPAMSFFGLTPFFTNRKS